MARHHKSKAKHHKKLNAKHHSSGGHFPQVYDSEGFGRPTRDYNHDDYQPEHFTRDGYMGDGRGHIQGTTGHYPENEGQMSRFGQRDMIQEDRSRTANLPGDVQMTAYPNSYGFLPG